MVGHGARIAVATVSALQDLVDAPLLPHTLVFRAIVCIVAQVDVITFHQFGLVGLTIAFVVLSVAGLDGWCRCVAFGQPFHCADAFALARAEFVRLLALCPQAEFNRGIGAGAGSGLGHALLQLYAVDRGNRVALETPRAVPVFPAFAAAETPLVAVVDASVFRAGRAGAIIGLGAGAAEVGVV